MDITRLMEAARTITPAAEVHFRGIPDREDWWVCSIQVRGAILVESSAGPLDSVIDDVTKKLKKMSTRLKAVCRGSEPPSSR